MTDRLSKENSCEKDSGDTTERIVDIAERIMIMLMLFLDGMAFFITGLAVASGKTIYTIVMCVAGTVAITLAVFGDICAYRNDAKFYERMSDRWRDIYLNHLKDGGECAWTISMCRYGKQITKDDTKELWRK